MPKHKFNRHPYSQKCSQYLIVSAWKRACRKIATSLRHHNNSSAIRLIEQLYRERGGYRGYLIHIVLSDRKP